LNLKAVLLEDTRSGEIPQAESLQNCAWSAEQSHMTCNVSKLLNDRSKFDTKCILQLIY
jgi:hypothetical protein